MAVNLSSRVLREPHLAEQIADLIATCGLDPDAVELEITDRVVMDDDVLAALHATGVRLGIDDYGTGNSVLRRLQRYPIDTLKIDRSLIETIRASVPDAPVVTALLTMAESLGFELVAEGVERADQADFLRGHTYRLVHGFYFSTLRRRRRSVVTGRELAADTCPLRPMIVRVPSGPRHDIGTEVEVRNRFEGGWSRGFVVVEVIADGYVIRRQSDGAVLDCVFPSSTVRPTEPRR